MGEVYSLLTCHCCHHTHLPVGAQNKGMFTVTVEGALSVNALTISTQRLLVAFVHI